MSRTRCSLCSTFHLTVQCCSACVCILSLPRYEKGTDEQQRFIQNLALFFTGFFKVCPCLCLSKFTASYNCVFISASLPAPVTVSACPFLVCPCLCLYLFRASLSVVPYNHSQNQKACTCLLCPLSHGAKRRFTLAEVLQVALVLQ